MWQLSEKAMATHVSTLAWRIPWTEEPGRLPSLGWRRVRHNWVTSFSLFTCMHWRRKWQPTPVFLPGESQGWGAWWVAIYGVAQSQTWLKRLSLCRRCGNYLFVLCILYDTMTGKYILLQKSIKIHCEGRREGGKAAARSSAEPRGREIQPGAFGVGALTPRP